MAAPIVIKKYGNRRLYDTGDSRYVTLDELALKIRGGADLRIVDAQTNEDLTQATLTQLVLETGNAAKFLPVQLLTQMIRLSDDSLAEFFSRYVTSALDMYLQAKRGVQTIAAYNPLAGMMAGPADALTRMFMGSPFGTYPPPQAPGYPPAGSAPGYPPDYPTNAPPYVAPPPPPEASEPSDRAPDRPAERPSERAIDRDRERERGDDVAAMRRELDELKQAIREGLGSRGDKDKKSKKSKR